MTSDASQCALTRTVCEVLGWKGANGKPKVMNTRLFLNKLRKMGKVVLPPFCGPVLEWNAS
ncbi:hypothetical protein [Leptospirillum sp. Group II 'CF-1']|uniref:hypothetical protein n=1 Tax=Leptospirillum sp. Group II 'CF-1' TaxID=1660083 RepID=UPI000B1C09B8|nr:hypothetical protein [Leptospirillum sp. Group II 'CF-1']